MYPLLGLYMYTLNAMKSFTHSRKGGGVGKGKRGRRKGVGRMCYIQKPKKKFFSYSYIQV